MPTQTSTVRNTRRNSPTIIPMRSSAHLDRILEDMGRKLDSSRFQALTELRPDAGWPETSNHPSIAGHPAALEHEDVLRRHQFAFHPEALGDVGDFACSVR